MMLDVTREDFATENGSLTLYITDYTITITIEQLYRSGEYFNLNLF